MSGQFNFGYHHHMPLLSIRHNLADIILGIVAAVAQSVFLCPPCTHFGEFGVGFDFNTPALVFGEVPVQHIHFVQGEQINVSFYKVNAHEVPAAIEQHASVHKGWLVLNLSAGQEDAAGDCGVLKEHLTEGLDGVEHSGSVAGFDMHGLSIHADRILAAVLAYG